MDESINVVFSHSLGNPLCSFDVYVLQREIPARSVRWGGKWQSTASLLLRRVVLPHKIVDHV